MKKIALLALSLTFAAFAFANLPENFDTLNKKYNLQLIWPEGKMPANSPEALDAAKRLNQRKNVINKPHYSLNLQKSQKPTTLVIVVHGGAYRGCGIVCEEGTMTANAFYEKGYSTLTFDYRAPDNPQGALQDMQRVIRLARHNAKKWNVDKIVAIGFSAGANLVARASAPITLNSYQKVDEIDNLSPIQDATILIYPAYCDQPTNELRWKNIKPTHKDYNLRYALAENLKITKNTPPVFMYEMLDDSHITSAIAYFLAARDAGVEAELHVKPKGGHGGGMNFRKGPDPIRLQLCVDWLDRMNFARNK